MGNSCPALFAQRVSERQVWSLLRAGHTLLPSVLVPSGQAPHVWGSCALGCRAGREAQSHPTQSSGRVRRRLEEDSEACRGLRHGGVGVGGRQRLPRAPLAGRWLCR